LILKNVTVHSDFKVVINSILVKTYDLIDRMESLSSGCQAYGDEINGVVAGLISYVQGADYPSQFMYHTMSNIGPITEKTKAITESITSGAFFNAGNSFGELFKFVAFWDYKAPTA